MLERLAGRLKWEHSDLGLRIEIPARWSLQAIFAALVVGVAALGASELQWDIPSNEARLAVGVFSIIIVAVGACVVTAWLCWSLTGRTIVTISQSELRLQHRILGIQWDTRRFPTSDIHNLRYLPPTEIWAAPRTDTDPNTSKIQFQAKNKRIKFASGITEREACALFDRMQEIYKFPRDSELDQVRATR
jgi:hypothetical protein